VAYTVDGKIDPYKRGRSPIELKNDWLRCTVVPQRGGKLTSVLYKPSGFELLAQPRDGCYPPLSPGMPFDRGDASGWDDVFPSMGPETVGDAFYPDHGEIWTTRMQPAREGDALRLTCDCARVPCRYEKRVTLEGPSLRCDWRLTNTGAAPFACVWVCHCLLCWEPDVRFRLPASPFGVENALSDAPPPKDLSGTPPEGGMWKYELRGPLSQHRCEAFYPHSGVRLRMQFTGLAHLGFWLTAGGYRGEYNYAFEPSNGYFDTVSIARARGALPMLAPGQSECFSLTLAAFTTDKE